MKRRRSVATALAAAALAVTALVSATAGCNAQSSTGAPTSQDRAFGERVRAYLLDHPEVIEQAMEKLQARQDAEKAAAATASIASNRQALEHDARDGVAGNPKGAVTLVEFFDYRCPYCKAAEPELRKLLARHGDVRLVLKEFPILDVEDQTHISEDASRSALAELPSGAYLKVHEALLAQPRLSEAGIGQAFAAAGVTRPSASAINSAAISTHLSDTHALARAIGVDGTPAFIIGDKMIAGAEMGQLEAAIAAAAAHR